MICLISRPLLITSRRDWYQLKGLLKGFKLALRPWESSKNWWRYGQMKFVTQLLSWNKANYSLLAFDKENSIEFLLDFYTIYTITMWLCSLTPMVSMLLINWLLCHILWLWHITLIVTWHSVTVTWYLPTLHPSNKEKKRKRKEILNNNLAILPSHNKSVLLPMSQFFL